MRSDSPECLIIIGGRTGAGKTTLALALGEELQFPVVRKDGIKEEMADGLHRPTFDEATAGRLAVQSHNEALRRARRQPAVILEGPWRGSPVEDLRQLASERPTLQIFVEASDAVRAERVFARAGTRHPVHREGDPAEAVARFASVTPYGPPDLGVPTLRVDTSTCRDPRALAREVALWVNTQLGQLSAVRGAGRAERGPQALNGALA